MASRKGKKKKKVASRMDAAIVALTPFGFSKPMIRNTVRNLLKIYGEDAAWYFVEEGNYKLVIDTIMEEQENEENREEVEVQRNKKEEEKTNGTSPKACIQSIDLEDPSQPSSSHPVFGRKPCFGWISEDEEDEETVPIYDIQVEKRVENITLQQYKNVSRKDGGCETFMK